MKHQQHGSVDNRSIKAYFQLLTFSPKVRNKNSPSVEVNIFPEGYVSTERFLRGRHVFSAALFLSALLLLFSPPSVLSNGPKLSGHLNINTATITELRQLPYIGEEGALAILEHRRQHGPIKDLIILLENDAIGQKAYESIKPYITFSGPSSLQYIGPNETGDQILMNSQRIGNRDDASDDIHSQPAEYRLVEQRDRQILSTRKIRTIGLTKPDQIRTLPDEEYYDALFNALNNATDRIDIIMYLFKTTDSPYNRAGKIIDKLIAARRQGVQVRVLLEKSEHNKNINRENNRVAEKLRHHGIQVEFDSPRTTTHAKLVIVDRQYVFVGSHNLTHSALSENHEVSLLINSRRLAEEMLTYMGGILKESGGNSSN